MIEDTEDLEPVDVPGPESRDWWGGPPAPDQPGGGGSAPWRPSLALVVVIAMAAAGLLGYAVTRKLQSGPSLDAAAGGTSPTVPAPGGAQSPTTLPGRAVSRDPDANVVTRLGLQQRDVSSGYSVALIPNGDQAGSGTTTLDLCNGTFPSESLRTARFQVVEADTSLNTALSTEAVLYKNPAAAAQALRELRSVRTKCPHSPVVSPVGEPTVTTTFNASPDATWTATPGVERLAYDFTTVDDSGTSDHSVAVYLRRGRALIGLYFAAPDGAQPPVAGQRTIEAITKVFEQRLAALPASVVNRS
jgi:hypothetical protein